MTERTEYAPGTPSWIDLGTPDLAAATKFYGDLFGWTVDADDRAEAGGYAMARLDGKDVAGLGPQMNTDVPPFWAVYVSVADADATVARATVHGATVVVEPMDVFELGRFAVLQDPLGSFISVWQPMQHIGARLVNQNGTFGWNELATTDIVRSREFYEPVFDWSVQDGTPEGGAIFTVGGEMVCGAHAAEPGEFPAWSVWFTVDDCDATTAKVTELGGSVLVPPSDMSFGRGAVVADPQGAAFGLAAMAG